MAIGVVSLTNIRKDSTNSIDKVGVQKDSALFRSSAKLSGDHLLLHTSPQCSSVVPTGEAGSLSRTG